MLRTRPPLESEELRVSGYSPMAFLVATLRDAGNRGHKGPVRITYGGLVAAKNYVLLFSSFVVVPATN